MKPQKVLEIANSWECRIILTAAELDLFRWVMEPADSDDIATKNEWNPTATLRILDALAAIGVVLKNDGMYELPDDLKEALSDGPKSIVPMLLHRARLWKVWSSLTDVVKTGINYYELTNEPDEVREAQFPTFIRAMATVGYFGAEASAEVLDLEGVKSLLDIGGGPGLYAAAFAEKIPDARVAVLDMPGAKEIAEEFIGHDIGGGRVEYLKSDCLTASDELVVGDGKWDLIFMSNLIHSMSPDEIQELFKRAARWCSPGGRIVVKDFFLDDDRINPPGAAIFSINMLAATPGGSSYTWTEIERWMMDLKNENGESAVASIERLPMEDGMSGMVIASVAG